MTTEAAHGLPESHDTAPGHGSGGPSSMRIVIGYGFWLFILSDIVLFSTLFAAYAVLSGRTAGGPTGKDLFDLSNVAIETACLLFSSFTCGILTLATDARRHSQVYLAGLVTFLLGACFIGLEVREFIGMSSSGAGPDRSAFLSAFFTLVGTHGLHVTCGLIWLAVMMIQVATRGFRPSTMWRMHCFALFWHALDIVWIGLFTIVYLMGVL